MLLNVMGLLQNCGEIPFFSINYRISIQYMGNSPYSSNYQRGMAGEAVAVSYLRSKGYRILERNYRYRKAEIDILALQQDCLAVVEVKTRTEDFYEALSASISKPKIKRLVIAADHFVRERKLEVAVRFDIIQLKKKSAGYQLTHIKNAFYHF